MVSHARRITHINHCYATDSVNLIVSSKEGAVIGAVLGTRKRLLMESSVKKHLHFLIRCGLPPTPVVMTLRHNVVMPHGMTSHHHS
jgi:hypothetical protein